MSDDLLSLPLDEVIKRKQKVDKNANSNPKKAVPKTPKSKMQKNQEQKSGSAQRKKKRPAVSKPGAPTNNLAKTKKAKQYARSNPQPKGERKRANKIPVASQGVHKQGQRKQTSIKGRKNSQGNPNRNQAQTVRRNQNKRNQNGKPAQHKNQTNPTTPVRIIVPNDLADQPLQENVRKRKHEDTRANVAEEFIALEPRSHSVTKHNDSSRNRSVRRRQDIPEVIESDGEDEATLLQEFEMFRKMRRAEKRRRELSAQQDSEEQDVEIRNMRKVIAVGSSRTSSALASASQEGDRLRRLGTGLFK